MASISSDPGHPRLGLAGMLERGEITQANINKKRTNKAYMRQRLGMGPSKLTAYSKEEVNKIKADRAARFMPAAQPVPAIGSFASSGLSGQEQINLWRRELGLIGGKSRRSNRKNQQKTRNIRRRKNNKTSRSRR